jgi:hypothetical protein
MTEEIPAIVAVVISAPLWITAIYRAFIAPASRKDSQ